MFKSINFLINDHINLKKDWSIRCWNENTLTWDLVNISFNNFSQEIEMSPHISENVNFFNDILWEAGLIHSESEQLILKWINSKQKENLAPIAVSFDTNLILRGFLRNIIETIIEPGYHSLDFLVLLTRTVINEFHSMTNAKYKGYVNKKRTQSLIKEIKQNDSISKLIFGRVNDPDLNYNRIEEISNNRGRRGLKGQIEIDYMYKTMKNQVLLVKPTNFFRTPFSAENRGVDELLINIPDLKDEFKELLTWIGSKGLNDMLDNLIREEIDFFRTQTNCQVLFITLDKQQSTSSNLEYLDCVYLERPNRKGNNYKFSILKIKERNIAKLILALITKYPFIEIITEKEKLYFAISWIGKNLNELKNGTIAVVIDNSNREIISIDNL